MRTLQLAAAALGLLLAACGAATYPAIAPAPALPPAGVADIYVAVGASETVGAGIDDFSLRLRDEWPQLFFNAALSRSSTFVDLGIPGATTDQAMREEVGQAVALHPTVATVWLNVDDLVRGVPAATYEQQLGRLVHALRATGATVLVANTPVLQDLPAVAACRAANGTDAPGPSTTAPATAAPAPDNRPAVSCPLPAGTPIPADSVINATVDAYNAAIARVVKTEHAILVDLHAQGDVAATHPELVATDGFHPSFLGHAAVARLFADAFAARPR